MECLHFPGIAIGRTMRTRHPVEAAGAPATLAFGRADMMDAIAIGETLLGMRLDGTGFQARFSDT